MATIQDMAGATITNMADPVNLQDAMTMGFTQVNFPQQYTFSGTTTTATPATLATIALDATTTTFITAFVVARCTGGSAGTVNDGLGFVVNGAFKMIAGAATQIGLSLPTTAQDKFVWGATLVPSSGSVIVQASGATNTNISWKVIYQLIKV